MIEMLFDMWTDDWIGKCVAVVLVLFALVVIGLVGFLACLAVDYCFMPEQTGTATVVGRHFEPAHNTTTFIMVGKVSVPQVHYHPDSWSLYLRIDDGREGDIAVSEDIFDTTPDGATGRVQYRCGRLFGGIYINEWERTQ